MSKIKYVVGDATHPIGKGGKIICHIVNDENQWGAGFVLALSKRWKAPEEDYRFLFDTPSVSPELKALGSVRMIPVEYEYDNTIAVANIIGQSGVNYPWRRDAPIRYDAVRTALTEVNQYAVGLESTLHMPRMGCGLGGGKWEEIEKIINEVITVDVTVYDLP